LPNVTVYDIDLFKNLNSTIASLYALNRSIIYYFSTGSYKIFYLDFNQFQPTDYVKPLDGWLGKYWLNTNSSNIKNIMAERLKLIISKGCNGVDPNNIDSYNNGIGLNLITLNAINYLKFLAIGAYSLNILLGLKNAVEIIN
jgi:hypothetical protein